MIGTGRTCEAKVADNGLFRSKKDGDRAVHSLLYSSEQQVLDRFANKVLCRCHFRHHQLFCTLLSPVCLSLCENDGVPEKRFVVSPNLSIAWGIALEEFCPALGLLGPSNLFRDDVPPLRDVHEGCLWFRTIMQCHL